MPEKPEAASATTIALVTGHGDVDKIATSLINRFIAADVAFRHLQHLCMDARAPVPSAATGPTLKGCGSETSPVPIDENVDSKETMQASLAFAESFPTDFCVPPP